MDFFALMITYTFLYLYTFSIDSFNSPMLLHLNDFNELPDKEVLYSVYDC